jgi:hypothetical protein
MLIESRCVKSKFGAWVHLACLGLACALPTLLLAPFFTAPIMTDEGVFGTVAQELLRGSVLYRDVFDNSPPLAYVWYALAFIIFGERPWVPHALLALAMSATTLLVYLEGRLLYSRGGSLAAAFAFGLASALAVLGPRAQKEYLALPLLVGALVLFTLGIQTGRHGWFLGAGVASALGILTSQLLAVHFLVLVAFVGWRERRSTSRLHARAFRRILLLVSGVLAVFFLVTLPYIFAAAERDLFYGLVEYPLLYANDSVQSRWDLAVSGLVWFVPVAAPWFFTSIVGLITLLRSGADQKRLLVLSWAFASAIAILIPGHFRRYYFILLIPGMALLTGYSLSAIPYLLSRRVRRAGLYLGLFSTVFLSAYLNGFVYAQPSAVDRLIASGGADYRLREAQSPTVAAYVAEHTGPGDRIFNLGRQTEFYFYSNRRPASRYIDTYPLDYDPRTLSTLIADLERTRPTYIIDTQWPMYLEGIDSPYPAALRDFLQRHYALERTFDFDSGLVTAYMRLSAHEDDVSNLRYFADVWHLTE